MCVYMPFSVCDYTCICVHACVYVHVSVCLCVFACVYACLRVYAYVSVFVYACVNLSVSMCIYMCIFSVLAMESTTSQTLGRCSTSELHTQSQNFLISIILFHCRTRFHYLCWVGLELAIFLLQHPKGTDYRPETPCLGKHHFYSEPVSPLSLLFQVLFQVLLVQLPTWRDCLDLEGRN